MAEFLELIRELAKFLLLVFIADLCIDIREATSAQQAHDSAKTAPLVSACYSERPES